MLQSLIFCSTLALLASVSAVPTPGTKEDVDHYIVDNSGMWPRADINKPLQVVYCPTWSKDWDQGAVEKLCNIAEGKEGGGRGTKPECINFTKVQGWSSLSPGTDLNCTVFARPDCNPGKMNQGPFEYGGGITARRYKDAVSMITYPGRGNFGDMDWIDEGFSSKEFMGRPPASVSCQKIKR